MSEDDERGGKGTVSLPKLGPVNKKVLIGVGVGGAALVAWRYWKARQDAAAAATDATGTDFADGGTLPSVAGAVSPDNSYGSSGGSSTTAPDSSSYGFNGTTNSQWTQYAASQLSMSESWTYTAILSALGSYLAGRSLSSTDVQIVQAAIAVAGYPPEGQHPILTGGGNTGITIAPTGVKAQATGPTSVVLTWNPVAGNSGYVAQESGGGSASQHVAGTSATFTGLKPGTTYSYTVAALSSSGAAGPKSSVASVKTPAQPTTGGGTAKPPASSGGSKPPAKPPAKASPRYPARRQWHPVVLGDNYTRIANEYHTGLSGRELWAYQSDSHAGHSKSAAKTLHDQGPDLLHVGQSVAVPYPK